MQQMTKRISIGRLTAPAGSTKAGEHRWVTEVDGTRLRDKAPTRAEATAQGRSEVSRLNNAACIVAWIEGLDNRTWRLGKALGDSCGPPDTLVDLTALTGAERANMRRRFERSVETSMPSRTTSSAPRGHGDDANSRTTTEGGEVKP